MLAANLWRMLTATPQAASIGPHAGGSIDAASDLTASAGST
jgi:hypothetical protein